MKITFLGILFILLLVLAAEILIYIYPSAGLPISALLDRDPVCTPYEALAGARIRLNVNKNLRSLVGECELVRKEARYELWKTPRGEFWVPSGGGGVLAVLLAQQAANIYGIGERTVVAGDVVLDCGAHVGVFTRKALELGAEKVVAIEPDADNFECLKRNNAAEVTKGQVILCAKGVWEKETVLPFFTYPDNTAADSFVTFAPGAAVEHLVPVTTIDKLVDELGLSRINYIKMDVKGSASKALLGARYTVARFRPKFALSTEEDDARALISIIRSFGSNYHFACGICAVGNDLRVIPEVVFSY